MDIGDKKGDSAGVNVTDGTQNTQPSQKASHNGVKQYTDSLNLEKSISLNGFLSGMYSTDVNQYFEIDTLCSIETPQARRLRISQMENYSTDK